MIGDRSNRCGPNPLACVHAGRCAGVRTAHGATPRRTFLLLPGLLLLLTLLCSGAHAVDAGIYVLMPTVNQGEREIDWHSGIESAAARGTGESDSALGLGMGVANRWFAELEIQFRKPAGAATALDAIEWQNTLALAEPNEWPIDVSLALGVERSFVAGEALLLSAGPLLQKDFGRMQANLNLLLDRYLHSMQSQPAQIEYQAQIKYRYHPFFEFGVQAFGTFSSSEQTWASLADEVHRLGPVVLGRISLPGERALGYNAALLVGTTAHTPDRTIRFQLEYEF